MSASVHPIILLAALGSAAALVAIALACRAKSWVNTLVLWTLAIVLLVPAAAVLVAVFPEIVDPRFRTYKALYHDIRIGMTREEVMAQVALRYPANASRKPPKVIENTPTRLGFFMNPEHSMEPNCEGIFLELREGRVLSKTYSAD